MKIAYLGPDGSYSYYAAKKFCEGQDGQDCVMMPERSFYEVLEALETDRVDIGVLPLENSTEGIVTPVVDLIYMAKFEKIIGEIIMPIHHGLFNLSGRLEDIKYVYSNAQPLEQCKKNLLGALPNCVLVECPSTTQACEIAREKGPEYGAIVGEQAGALFGLKLVRGAFQDNEKNATRFVILKKQGRMEPTGVDKTSIAFTFHEDRPGSLYEVLQEFAFEKINLSRIESRPMKEELGKYVFFVDFLEHIENPKVFELLERVKKRVFSLKVLGSYPIGRTKTETP